MRNGRLAGSLVASLLLTILSLTFADADPGFVLCAGIALFSGLCLLVRAVVSTGRRRLAIFLALAAYVGVQTLGLTHYRLVRDRVRWGLLSGVYESRVLAQPVAANGRFRHVEWDGWGFAGADTTVFLVFDPADSLAKELGAPPPVKAPGLPCDVVHIRRLARQWYAVLFYTETYWGQGDCK
jgi:hypothetical protein